MYRFLIQVRGARHKMSRIMPEMLKNPSQPQQCQHFRGMKAQGSKSKQASLIIYTTLFAI